MLLRRWMVFGMAVALLVGGASSLLAADPPSASAARGSPASLSLPIPGTAVAWGDNFLGRSTVPAGLTNVVAIAAGFSHTDQHTDRDAHAH
ncbi:MAG: hypothetical protein ACJ8CR_09155 [Roseiflexaceae bacterium]